MCATGESRKCWSKWAQHTRPVAHTGCSKAFAVTSQVRQTGWLPQHVLLKTGGASPQLLACCPLYLKSHSYGEYVFDHSWAGYFSRSGQAYYPKLQSCVPFTPASGNRLLVRPDAYAPALSKALGKGLTDIAGTALALPSISPDPEGGSCVYMDTLLLYKEDIPKDPKGIRYTDLGASQPAAHSCCQWFS